MDLTNREIISVCAALAGVPADAMPPGKGSPEMGRLLDRTRFAYAYGGPAFKSAAALSQWLRYRIEGRRIRGEGLRRFLRLAARNAYAPGVRASLEAILAAPESAEEIGRQAAGFLAMADEYSQDTATQHARGKPFFLRHYAADLYEHVIAAGADATEHSIKYEIVNLQDEPLSRMSIPAFFDARLGSAADLRARIAGDASVEVEEFSGDRCLFSVRFRKPLALAARVGFALAYRVPGEWEGGGPQEYRLGANIPLGEMRFSVVSAAGGPKISGPACDRTARLAPAAGGFLLSLPYPEPGSVSFKFDVAR